MKNPDKYIRFAYLGALAGIGVPVYDEKIPKSTIPAPATYVLITSQTKNRDHSGRGCVVEDCTITLDIISVQALGFGSTVILNDIEEAITNAILTQPLPIEHFQVVSTNRADSFPASFDTDSQSVYRRILRYRHILEETTLTTT